MVLFYFISPLHLRYSGTSISSILVYDQNFMQALTRPNTIAVLETDTTFTEDHKIVFDVLEFTEGQRLYGCCYNTKLDADGSFTAFNLIEYQFHSVKCILCCEDSND